MTTTVTCRADLEDLRSWAFTRMAEDDADTALDHLDTLEPAPEWRGPLFELTSEIYVRAGIALSDPALVQDGLMPPLDDSVEPEHRAMLARGIGAGWLAEDLMHSDGASVRFRAARPWVTLARWGLGSVLERDGLTPAQREEGHAALRRLYEGAWRIWDGADAVAMARQAPAALRPARDALRQARSGFGVITPDERGLLIGDALLCVAASCQPAWPVHGGPWWISIVNGLTIDVSEPTDEAGRHRFALADAFMELEDMPPGLLGEDADEPDTPEVVRKRQAYQLQVADAILAHAIGSRLAE